MNTKFIFAALVSGLLVLPAAGCMEDRGEDYRARYDRETDLYTEEVEPGITTGQERSFEEQGVIEGEMEENELADEDLTVESDLNRDQSEDVLAGGMGESSLSNIADRMESDLTQMETQLSGTSQFDSNELNDVKQTLNEIKQKTDSLIQTIENKSTTSPEN